MGMKACIVNVLDTLSKHTSWTGSPDLHFTLHWLCQNLRRVQKLSTFLCSINSWKYKTLHSNCPCYTLQPHTMTWCPWPTFHAPLTLSKFYVKSRNKVHFSAAVISGSILPCIVIIFDSLNNHALWPGALDLHCMLHWLCPNCMSSLKIKCISLCSSNGCEYETLHTGCPWHTFQAHTMTIFLLDLHCTL